MKPQMTPQGVALLRQAREKILSDPECFDMSDWFDLRPFCKSTACIAGWVVILAKNSTVQLQHQHFDSRFTTPQKEATELLFGEVNHETEKAVSHLFYRCGWRADICDASWNCSKNNDQKGYAETAAIAIDWFIAEFGPQKEAA